MKRIYLILFLCCFFVGLFAQVAEERTVEIEGANSTDEKVVAQVVRETRASEFNHWMISLGGGFNLMMVERQGTQKDPLHSYRNNFQGAGYFNFGYMINPIWGVIAEYGFIPINKKIFTPEGDVTGYGHEATIQLDFNILNLVRKCRKNTKWNVDALVGAGFLAYNSRYHLDAESGEKDHYYYPAICVPVSLKFQYCPIDQLGIGLRISGKWYSEDDINYVCNGVGNHNNDMAFYCGLELQYNVTTPGKSHVRVTDRCTYEPMNVVLEGKIVDVNKNAEKIQEMEEELEDVKQEIAVLNGTLDPEEARARREAARQLSANATEPLNPATGTNGNAGAPNDNNKYPYDELYNDVQDLKGQVERLRQQLYMTNGTDENTVYFEFDSDVITPYYELVLAKVARNLLKDKELTIDLISYCDKHGTDGYNQELGNRRVNNVYDMLVNKFKVEKSRIKIRRYDGQIKDDWDAINRRCDIIYK